MSDPSRLHRLHLRLSIRQSFSRVYFSWSLLRTWSLLGKKVPDGTQSGVCLHKWARGRTKFTVSPDACPGFLFFFFYSFSSVFWIIGHKGLRLSICDYGTASYNFMSFLILSKVWLCLQYQRFSQDTATNRKHCVTHAAWLEDPALSKPL